MAKAGQRESRLTNTHQQVPVGGHCVCIRAMRSIQPCAAFDSQLYLTRDQWRKRLFLSFASRLAQPALAYEASGAGPADPGQGRLLQTHRPRAPEAVGRSTVALASSSHTGNQPRTKKGSAAQAGQEVGVLELCPCPCICRPGLCSGLAHVDQKHFIHAHPGFNELFS